MNDIFKYIKRIFIFIAAGLGLLIIREFVEFYHFTDSLHPILGYLVLFLLLIFTMWFIVIPVIRLFSLPAYYSPVKDKTLVDEIIKKRMEKFRSNKFLAGKNINPDDYPQNEEGYNDLIKVFSEETRKVRAKYINMLFYSTSISQNGFIDGLFILSANFNLMKEIFVLYHGRAPLPELIKLLKKIYIAVAIGGSESVEYITDELFTRMAADSLKSFPFADKIFSSLADGFVNAMLMTRISIITENYCKKAYIKSDRDLFPAQKTVAEVTKAIFSGIIDTVKGSWIKIAKERGEDFVRNSARAAANPLRFLLGKAKKVTGIK